MAVPIFVWNGTAWESTGPTIPASPIKYQASAPSSPSTGDIWVDSDADVTSGSQQFQRFRFVASGGETTISGADANGAVLAYTAGAELVVLNGSTLVRGQDYTATNGTSITGLSPALVANDVLEVFSFMAFNVANTYTQAQVDGLIAAANDAIGMKLLIPTSAVNGTVSATGAVTFSGVSSVSLNGVLSSTYDNYRVIFTATASGTSTTTELRFRLRTSSGDDSTNMYVGGVSAMYVGGTTIPLAAGVQPGTYCPINLSYYSGAPISLTGDLRNINGSGIRLFNGTTNTGGGASAGYGIFGMETYTTSNVHTGMTFYSSSAMTLSGTVRVYGYKN